jgi:hypothetical protein
MVTHTTPLASTHGLRGAIVSVTALDVVAVRRGVGGPAIAFIGAPAEPPTSMAGSTLYQFGSGSIWIVAPLLAPEAPANGLMGVRVATLRLSVPGPLSMDGTDIIVAPADSATLTLVPAPPDPVSGFVNDGTTTTSSLPAQIEFLIGSSDIGVTALGDASFSTLGTSVALTGGLANVAYDAAAKEIVFVYNSAAPTNFLASGASLSGQAAVLGGQYRLPVAETAPTALGAAVTGGVPTAVVAGGLSWRFGSDAVRLGPAQVLAEQGSLGLRALVDRRSFTDAFTMWTAAGSLGGGRPTSLVFIVPRGAILALVQSAVVEARLLFGAAVQAAIDRPLTVAGKPIVLDRLLASYAVTRTSNNITLNLLGLPRPPDPGLPAPPAPPIEVLAIENALLRTNGVVWLTGALTLDGSQAVAGLLLAGMVLRDLLPTLPDPYVSNDQILQRPMLSAGLLAEIGWSNPAAAGIGFTLATPRTGTAAQEPGFRPAIVGRMGSAA